MKKYFGITIMGFMVLLLIVVSGFSAIKNTASSPAESYWFPLSSDGSMITATTITKAGHTSSSCSGSSSIYCEVELTTGQFIDNGLTVTANSSVPPSGSVKTKRP